MVDTLDKPGDNKPETLEPINTYPTDDWFEHILGPYGMSCKCNPRKETYGDDKPAQIIHNSFDGREHLEEDHDWRNCEVCQGDLVESLAS